MNRQAATIDVVPGDATTPSVGGVENSSVAVRSPALEAHSSTIRYSSDNPDSVGVNGCPSNAERARKRSATGLRTANPQPGADRGGIQHLHQQRPPALLNKGEWLTSVADHHRRRPILRDTDRYCTERIEDRLNPPRHRRIVHARLKLAESLPGLGRKRAPEPLEGVDEPVDLRQEGLAIDRGDSRPGLVSQAGKGSEEDHRPPGNTTTTPSHAMHHHN